MSQDYGETFASSFDAVHSDLAPSMLDFLLSWNEVSSALDLGAGTGRIALALARKGIKVWGVESSSAMIEILKRKDVEGEIQIVQADLPNIPIDETFDLITLVDNTLLLVSDQNDQARLISSAAQKLNADGVLIIETGADEGISERGLSLQSLGDDHVVLWAYEVNLDNQKFKVQEIILEEGNIKILPFEGRYVTSAELDLMASFAGLERIGIFKSWSRDNFETSEKTEIYVYRRKKHGESRISAAS